MRGTKVLTALVIGALTTGTIWAQMGDGDGSRPKRPAGRDKPQLERDGEGRGPGMRGPEGDRQPPMEMVIGRLIENPEMVRKLGLTEEQVNALKEGIKSLREEHTTLREQMRLAAEEQVKLLQADPINEAAVMAAVEKTGALRTEIAKLRIKGMLLAGNILTSEQAEKIKEHIRTRMQQRGAGPEGENGEAGRPGRDGKDRGWGRGKNHNGDAGNRGGRHNREQGEDVQDDGETPEM